MKRAPLCILVAGDPVAATLARAGGFASLVGAGLADSWRHGLQEVDVRTTEALPPLEGFSGLIVTGSASSVTERAPWMLRTEAYLAQAVSVAQPVLGICFGHQLLGQALGGLVERNPNGREMGTVRVNLLEEDPVLGPDLGQPVLAHATHVDSVTVLPASARVLASTALEPNAAVRFGPRAWGVQFHPEFDARVMAEYVEARRAVLVEEGLHPDALAAGIRPAAWAGLILRRFVEYGVGSREPST